MGKVGMNLILVYRQNVIFAPYTTCENNLKKKKTAFSN